MIKLNELEHDKKILANPEKIWGRSGLAGKKRLERRAKMIIEFCQITPEKKILEIGCGSGTLTEKLTATGAQITATDIFVDFLELTNKKITAKNVTTQLVDAETLTNMLRKIHQAAWPDAVGDARRDSNLAFCWRATIGRQQATVLRDVPRLDQSPAFRIG